MKMPAQALVDALGVLVENVHLVDEEGQLHPPAGPGLQLLDDLLEVVAELPGLVAVGVGRQPQAGPRSRGLTSRASTTSAMSAWKNVRSGTPWRSTKTGKNCQSPPSSADEHLGQVVEEGRLPDAPFAGDHQAVAVQGGEHARGQLLPAVVHVVVQHRRPGDVGVEAAAHGAAPSQPLANEEQAQQGDRDSPGGGEEKRALVELEAPFDREGDRAGQPAGVHRGDRDLVQARGEGQLADEGHGLAPGSPGPGPGPGCSPAGSRRGTPPSRSPGRRWRIPGARRWGSPRPAPTARRARGSAPGWGTSGGRAPPRCASPRRRAARRPGHGRGRAGAGSRRPPGPRGSGPPSSAPRPGRRSPRSVSQIALTTFALDELPGPGEELAGLRRGRPRPR